MTRIIRGVAVVVAACSAATDMTAQENVRPSGVLRGTVHESPTRAHGRRLLVCVSVPIGVQSYRQRCADVDSVGAYHLDSLPPVTMQFSVICEPLRWGGDGRLASDSMQITTGESSHRDWHVSTAKCDPRPVRSIGGEFRGHYSSGYEASEFVPCPEDAWFIPGDSLHTYPFDNRRAWATWTKRARGPIRWPAGAPRDAFGYSRYYVHWRGTVVGPGHYGHMGISAFEFFVDSVLEVRVPAARDCS